MKLLTKIKSLIVFFTLIFYAGVIFARTPLRIVSLAPSITDSLYQLNVEESLVGVTLYCRLSRRAEIVGTLSNPNMEKVFSLMPDFVFTIRGINRAETIKRLKDLGVNVVVFNEPETFDDILTGFIKLGEIVGKKESAEKIASEISKKVQVISEMTKKTDPAKVFFELNKRPLVTASSASFMNEFLKYSGSINIFNDIKIEHPRVSAEEVLRRNPSAIILVNMGDVSARDKEYWQTFKELSAARNNRIFSVNANNFCRPTPVSFLNSLREITHLLYPELFARGEFFE